MKWNDHRISVHFSAHIKLLFVCTHNYSNMWSIVGRRKMVNVLVRLCNVPDDRMAAGSVLC